MEPTAAIVAGSSLVSHKQDEHALESLQFGEEIQRLMTVPSKSANSFTALLELPATQAVKLLHSPDSGDSTAVPFSGETVHRVDYRKPFLTLPSNAALIERASKFSVFAAENNSSDTSSVPSNSSANLEKVKNEPMESDSNPKSSQPLMSDPTVEDKSQRSVKRKDREKKGKGSTKKSKIESSEDAEKLPYVHVRARRGQATDSHSLAERARREKINARMKLLQELVPGCSKISGTALVLDEIINHVQSLQRQVEFLSMRLATVNPRIDFNLETVLAAESGSLMDIDFHSIVVPPTWPEFEVNGNRQPYQPQWNFDTVQQPLWGREENHNFLTPENSLLSYDSSANSASLHSNQLKMEI